LRISITGTRVLIWFSGGRIFLTVIGVPPLVIASAFLELACFSQNAFPL
jgi:hypothetical protein